MIKKTILNIFILIGTISCGLSNEKKDSENYNYKTISINTSEMSKNRFNDIIDCINVLKLEECESNIIGEIDKILIDGNLMFILDRFISRKMFIYDNKGKFLRTIGKKGMGPGEYTSISYFDIDKNKKEIILLDSDQRKLLFYNYQGDFIRDIILPDHVISFIVYDKERILLDCGNNTFGNKNKHSLIVIDKQTGNVLEKLLSIPTEKENLNFSSYSPLFRTSDTIVYQPPFSKYLYKLENGIIKQKYDIDFGGKWPSDSYFIEMKGSNPMEIAKKIAQDGYVSFPNIVENSKFILVTFYINDNKVLFINDKTNNNNFITKDCPLIIGFHEDKFLGVKYNENENPILIFYTIHITD